MKIWVDGSPKGIALVTEDGRTSIVEEKAATSNTAEYHAVNLALEFAIDDGIKKLEIFSDSQLVVNQLKHEWHIKNDCLRRLARDIWEIIHLAKLDVTFTWIPREHNKAGKLLG